MCLVCLKPFYITVYLRMCPNEGILPWCMMHQHITLGVIFATSCTCSYLYSDLLCNNIFFFMMRGRCTLMFIDKVYIVYRSGSSLVKTLNPLLFSNMFGLDFASLLNWHELKTSAKYINRQWKGRTTIITSPSAFEGLNSVCVYVNANTLLHFSPRGSSWSHVPPYCSCWLPGDSRLHRPAAQANQLRAWWRWPLTQWPALSPSSANLSLLPQISTVLPCYLQCPLCNALFFFNSFYVQCLILQCFFLRKYMSE